MSDADPDCLFCKIAAREVPAEIVVSDDETVAFRDIDPQAPTHVLVIPRRHHANAAAIAEEEPEVLSAMVRTAHRVASEDGLEDHYRLVMNTGEGAGQSVFHVHMHLLGGRSLGWPPG